MSTQKHMISYAPNQQLENQKQKARQCKRWPPEMNRIHIDKQATTIILNCIHILLLFIFGVGNMEILSALPIPPKTPPPGVCLQTNAGKTRPGLQMSCNPQAKTQAEQTPSNNHELLIGKPFVVDHLYHQHLPPSFASRPGQDSPTHGCEGTHFCGSIIPSLTINPLHQFPLVFIRVGLIWVCIPWIKKR